MARSKRKRPPSRTSAFPLKARVAWLGIDSTLESGPLMAGFHPIADAFDGFAKSRLLSRIGPNGFSICSNNCRSTMCHNGWKREVTHFLEWPLASGWHETMQFDIYGRYQLEVVRKDERWIMYETDYGKRRLTTDFVIPASLRPDDLATYLDDMLHELARPGDIIQRID